MSLSKQIKQGAPEKAGIYVRRTALGGWRIERVIERDGDLYWVDPNFGGYDGPMPSGREPNLVPMREVTTKFTWIGPLPEED